eukprot:TRINITY_DN114_c0_g1_i2.p1 TRINITY_DN114_c0_g1~~TRINITY_DN114_c0_g1_i2.p1  ORF type:complete len:257 (+),score=28.83 TRINITY_DN114_c0_g1_i2:63-833(+)
MSMITAFNKILSIEYPQDQMLIEQSTNPSIDIDVNLTFQQYVHLAPLLATSVSAGLESFYRSALTTIINTKLLGAKVSIFKMKLFPSMHVQLPSRILYINGFKAIKERIEKSQYLNIVPRSASHAIVAVAPGLLMTPLVSLLEATTAKTENSKSLSLLQRSKVGFLPRGMREVLFGIGINQFSQYFIARFNNILSSGHAASFAGSIVAGALAGYLSHVPHLFASIKMLSPAKTYTEVAHEVVKKSERYLLFSKGII